jgi:hypothetical protein
MRHGDWHAALCRKTNHARRPRLRVRGLAALLRTCRRPIAPRGLLPRGRVGLPSLRTHPAGVSLRAHRSCARSRPTAVVTTHHLLAMAQHRAHRPAASCHEHADRPAERRRGREPAGAAGRRPQRGGRPTSPPPVHASAVSPRPPGVARRSINSTICQYRLTAQNWKKNTPALDFAETRIDLRIFTVDNNQYQSPLGAAADNGACRSHMTRIMSLHVQLYTSTVNVAARTRARDVDKPDACSTLPPDASTAGRAAYGASSGTYWRSPRHFSLMEEAAYERRDGDWRARACEGGRRSDAQRLLSSNSRSLRGTPLFVNHDCENHEAPLP